MTRSPLTRQRTTKQSTTESKAATHGWLCNILLSAAICEPTRERFITHRPVIAQCKQLHVFLMLYNNILCTNGDYRFNVHNIIAFKCIYIYYNLNANYTPMFLFISLIFRDVLYFLLL